MATKIEWNSFDYAARDVLDELLDKLGVSYREMENMTQGEVTYSRIRDIKMGNKAPVRLSEFLIICDVCGADPVQTVRGIIAEAKRIEEEQERERRVEETKHSRNSIEETWTSLPWKTNTSMTVMGTNQRNSLEFEGIGKKGVDFDPV